VNVRSNERTEVTLYTTYTARITIGWV